MGEIAGITALDLGAGALLGVVVMLILTGRLVPRSVLEDARAERDTWRAAHQVSEEARHSAQRQADELLDLYRTGVRALDALPRPGDGDRAC
ncbi:hypothetical protein JJV70_02080 [Streptomyces sp. JJ66]|uniref:hypothetical protein n=1 Tax=Streptomyces sp. JJ66 TaxID=2803843 RepID=UPI001C56382C|nr:hypothetical protein [Streptomyces sp. JJ66]MBW1600909.1 hypothetical protein [Streptomyces sp. JJ66]